MRVKNLIWFLENKCDKAADYLPDEYEKKNLNRQWLWNLCINLFIYNIGNSFNQEEFEEFIGEAVKERQDKYIQKYNMEIQTDPRIVEAFEMLNFISSKSYDNY